MFDSYAGEDFIINAPNFNDNLLSIFNGSKCRLIGFKTQLKVIADIDAELLKLDRGIYETIGYPVVTLPNGVVTPISLEDLIPIGYSFNDYSLDKNINYQRARNRYKFIKTIPHFYHGVGDIVLCSVVPNTACLILDFTVEENLTPSVIMMPVNEPEDESEQVSISSKIFKCSFEEVYSSLQKASSIGAHW